MVSMVGDLTAENFSTWVKKDQDIPVFLLLKSKWCPHCMELEPEWEQLRERYAESKNLMVADISCDENRKLCFSFPESGTPRIFWTDDGVESAQRYVNTYSLESFVKFIEKRLSDPLQTLWNHEEYEAVLKAHANESLVFVQSPGKELEDLLNELAQEYEKSPIRFFKFGYDELETGQTRLFYRFEPLGINEAYDQEGFKAKPVKQWVSERSYPPISEANSFFVSQMVKKKYFMVYFQSPDDFDFVPNITRIASKVPRWLKTGLIDCDKMPRVCRMFGINKYRGSHLVIVNAPRNRYFRFNDEFNDTAVEKWINDALNGKVHALGPGAGWSGFFFNLGLQVKTLYFWKYTSITVICIIVLAVVAVKVYRAADRWVNEEEMEKQRKMEQEFEKALEESAELELKQMLEEDERDARRLKRKQE